MDYEKLEFDLSDEPDALKQVIAQLEYENADLKDHIVELSRERYLLQQYIVESEL
jgi:cell division protein FtsB